MLRRPFRPRRPIFTWRALVFETVTIVIGVLIALGVNEARERLANGARVEAALTAIHAELADNCARFSSGVAYHQRLLVEVDSVLRVNPGASDRTALPSFRGVEPVFVTTVGYRVAESTGTLELMPYRMALDVGRLYTFLELYQASVREVLGAFSAGRFSTLASAREAMVPMLEMEPQLAEQTCAWAGALAGNLGLPADTSGALARTAPPNASRPR